MAPFRGLRRPSYWYWGCDQPPWPLRVLKVLTCTPNLSSCLPIPLQRLHPPNPRLLIVQAQHYLRTTATPTATTSVSLSQYLAWWYQQTASTNDLRSPAKSEIFCEISLLCDSMSMWTRLVQEMYGNKCVHYVQELYLTFIWWYVHLKWH